MAACLWLVAIRVYVRERSLHVSFLQTLVASNFALGPIVCRELKKFTFRAIADAGKSFPRSELLLSACKYLDSKES
jgi:hypothetical protein